MSWSCIICTETLQEEEIFSTLCGHLFHFHCISQWLKCSNTCPQCRAAVSLISLHKIYTNIQTITNSVIEEQLKTNEELTILVEVLKEVFSARINESECKMQNHLMRIDAEYEENQKVISDLKKRVEKAIKSFESYNSELKSLVEGKSDLAAAFLSVKDELSEMKRNMCKVEGAIATVGGQINTVKGQTKQQKMELAKLKRELKSNKENEARVGPTLRRSKRIALQNKNAAGTA